MKIGHCHYDSLSFGGALQQYREAYEDVRSSGAGRALAVQALRNLGNTNCRLGLFGEAVEFYEESRRLAILLSDVSSQAHAELGLSYALRNRGEPTQALEAAERAEDLYRHGHDSLGIVMAQHNKAVAAIDLNLLSEAETWLDAAASHYHNHDDDELEAAVLEEKARLWQIKGATDEAIKAAATGLRLLEGRPRSTMYFRLMTLLGLFEIQEQPASTQAFRRLREAAQGFVELSEAHELAQLIGRLLNLIASKEVGPV